jgi:hypothetical protein
MPGGWICRVLGADLDADGPEAPPGWRTGSVISDRVFLTASHRTDVLPPETNRYVSLEAGSPRSPVFPSSISPADNPFASWSRSPRRAKP